MLCLSNGSLPTQHINATYIPYAMYRGTINVIVLILD